MAFFDCHFFSDALAVNVSAYVILPQKSTRLIGMAGGETRATYPTLYLVHGLSDDHTIWMRRTSIERYAAARNIAVVMPSVGRSFYQDMAYGPKYWTYVSQELPTMMQRFFPLSPEREDTFAAGLSMGGYGALRLGLARPDRFAAAASLSGALDYVRRLKEAGREGSRFSKAEWMAVAGEQFSGEGTESDLFATASQVAASEGPRPKLYVACGTHDELLEDSRHFHQHLDSLHYEHTYAEGPGAHEWGYWDTQIRQVLDWLPIRS